MIRQYHHKDFLPIEEICAKKRELGKKISLVIPAFNEASTVGSIVTATKKSFFEKCDLLDEIVVIDGHSDDETFIYAQKAGAQVFRMNEIGDTAVPHGKGAALWKSFYVTTGDIIVCIDADIKDFDIRFIYGLVAPLLLDPTIHFVKAFYKRPVIISNIMMYNFGGRVTEILVRPMLCTFYPELAKLFQPLSGEYSFRRETMVQIPFFSGYGVEIGMVLDVYKRLGLLAFAQVDMDIRCHRNRDLQDLGKMSFGILQALLKKLEEDKKLTLHVPLHKNMILNNANQAWDDVYIEEQELPPFISKGDGGVL
jgi:glucosyl-3-phosphoglycerate synthase